MKTWFITGCSSGFGRRLALAAAQRGDRVIATARDVAAIAEVDDAVQETLLAVHHRRHTYDPRYPLGPWLAAIAKNKWVDQLRSLARRPEDELPDEIPVGDHEAAVISSWVLTGLLEQLRPAQARAILLVKVQGFSVEEASRQIGLSPSAVKMNIHRRLARLTAIIEKTPDVE